MKRILLCTMVCLALGCQAVFGATRVKKADLLKRIAQLEAQVEALSKGVAPSLSSAKVYYVEDAKWINYGSYRELESIAIVINADTSKQMYYIIATSNDKTSVKENMALSRIRAKYVKDHLVKEFGVNPKRLQVMAIGEITEFPTPELNRFCLVARYDDSQVQHYVNTYMK